MERFCSECGKPIVKEGSQFCPECGAKIAPAPQVEQKPTVQPTEGPVSETPPSKFKQAGKWIAICCGGVILVAVIAAFIFGIMGGDGSISSPKPLSSQRDAADGARAIVQMMDGIVSSMGEGKYTRYAINGEGGTAFVTGSMSRSASSSADGNSVSSSVNQNFVIECVGYRKVGSTTIDGTITYSYSFFSSQNRLTYSSSGDVHSYTGKDVKITSPSLSDTVSFNINRKGPSGMNGRISGTSGSWQLQGE
jgi:DNA-directed RNA polymerase subunit RPC12/RpoP